jgi:hypothetical protein
MRHLLDDGTELNWQQGAPGHIKTNIIITCAQHRRIKMMQWQFHPPLPSVTEINTFVAAVSSTSQQQTFTQATTASPGQPLQPHNRCSHTTAAAYVPKTCKP